MTEQPQPELSPVATSFAERVRAFHQSLPPEEQALLEQVFALAETAVAGGEDTQGFFTIKQTSVTDGTSNTFTTPNLTGLLGLNLFGDGSVRT